ncbi:MAG: ABC transporter ATP-binding protein [Chloroflexota bacterium]
MNKPPRLSVNAVQHRYGNLQVISEMSLSVADGEFVALVGPSGSGKSTLLKLVAGLEQPTAGTIALDGTVTKNRLGQAAYMPQSDTLLQWRRVLDNVVLGREIQGGNLYGAKKQARSLLAEFGLGDFVMAYPAELSGGMRQRVALLRTMIMDCPLVLLDEPLSALDAFTRAELQDWLLSVRERLAHTVVLVTHDIEEAVYLADRIIVLSQRPGRIVADIPITLDFPRQRDSASFHEQVVAVRSHIYTDA